MNGGRKSNSASDKYVTSFSYAVNVNERGYISFFSYRKDWGNLIFKYYFLV